MNIDKRMILSELRSLIRCVPSLSDGACELAIILLSASGEMNVIDAFRIVRELKIEVAEGD